MDLKQVLVGTYKSELHLDILHMSFTVKLEVYIIFMYVLNLLVIESMVNEAEVVFIILVVFYRYFFFYSK